MSDAPDIFTLDDAKGLIARDARFVPLIEQFTPMTKRRLSAGYNGLFRLIVGQQLSTFAADAIMTKIVTSLGAIDAHTIDQADQDFLRSLGLSRQKISYMKALAREVLEGALDFDELSACDDGQVIARLTKLKGIGSWTALIYLMFCEGRNDCFPAGDLALQEAVKDLLGLEVRPNEAQCAELSHAWAPHKSFAAHLLWAHYGQLKRAKKAAN